MLIYANDYGGAFPRSGGKRSLWAGHLPNWQADNRFAAYGLNPDGTGGVGNISSCFYLLVKYCELTPKMFLCKGDVGVTEFNPVLSGCSDKELTDLWDFGVKPRTHCSYAYHQPFSPYPLTMSSEPGMAVAADRNPWIESPGAASTMTISTRSGTEEQTYE